MADRSTRSRKLSSARCPQHVELIFGILPARLHYGSIYSGMMSGFERVFATEFGIDQEVLKIWDVPGTCMGELMFVPTDVEGNTESDKIGNLISNTFNI